MGDHFVQTVKTATNIALTIVFQFSLVEYSKAFVIRSGKHFILIILRIVTSPALMPHNSGMSGLYH